MKAIDVELKAAKIDYSITRSANGEYLLHYKQANEQDVLNAQNHAIQARFGEPLDAQANVSQQAKEDQARESQEASEGQQREEAKREHERAQEPQRQVEHDAQTRAMLAESDRVASRVIPAVAGLGATYEPLESLKQEARNDYLRHLVDEDLKFAGIA